MNIKKKIAAIAQLRSTSCKLQNLQDVAHCARLAVQQNACMLFLPECFGFLGESAEQTLSEAEQDDDHHPMYNNNTMTMNTGVSVNDEAVTKLLRDTIHSTEPYYNTQRTTTNVDEIPSPPIPDTPKVTSLLDGLRVIAQESGLWISGGGLHLLANNNNGAAAAAVVVDGKEGPQPRSRRVYNTHVIVNDQGLVQARYHKIHLFDVDIPGQVSLQESATTAPGTDIVVCENTPLGTLGLTTCYDVRFPEQYQALRRRGADIVLVPSAFTVPTGQAHWHTLLRARAIETQCYVLAAAQYGRHNEKRTSFGHALAVDPWGTILADAGGYPSNDDDNHDDNVVLPQPPPSIITAEIDLDYLQQIRAHMPIEMHRMNAANAAAAAAEASRQTQGRADPSS
jgi:deaminated glutathione amidase